MATRIYYDFTSAECFALHEIVWALPAPPALQWRGVQSDPTTPVPMAALDRRAIGRLEMDVADAMRAVPGLEITVPRARPNTRAALQAVASVERMHAARAGDFRALLFRDYWATGSDLSDVAVLRRIAEAAGVPPWVELAHPAAQATQVSWELQWQVERLGGVPRAIRDDGQILWNVRDAADAHAFFAGVP